MARFRRAALGLLALGAGAAAIAVTPAGLVLAGGGKPGSLTIANHGPAPVTIARAIAVEWRDGTKWRTAQTEFNAVGSCPWMRPGGRTPAPVQSVSISPGASLRVVPWLGYTCSGQCAMACAANVYLGPGTFHFVATVLPGGARVIGPAFTLPPERPGDMMRNVLDAARARRAR